MNKIPEELKKILIWKLDIEIPPTYKLSVGNKGTFTREELKKHVEQEDEVGMAFANMQLGFMKALASGRFSEALAE